MVSKLQKPLPARRSREASFWRSRQGATIDWSIGAVASMLAVFSLITGNASLARAGDWPVSIETKYGVTKIDSAPQRVISLSYTGHDFLLSLGVKPIALRSWYGGYPQGVWPWAQNALGDARPAIMSGQIDIERIAAMKPDLIVGLWSGMSANDFRILSQIAPTVAPQTRYGDYGTPWRVMLTTLAEATGRQQEAERIIAAYDRRIRDIQNAHPDWQGKTGAVVWAAQLGAYTAGDIRTQLLGELGLIIPEAIERLDVSGNFYVTLSEEDLAPIDADVLIWLDAGNSIDQIRSIALRDSMRARREGREVYADTLLAGALSHSSPLSLNYALDRLVPLLEQALDGDPGTEVASTRKAGLLE
ncbi:iron-siderophore ABC transporter substrate-binding protein [Roseibium sp.]|uniref:iron-siderophore ABC transporter substrate-binding protein n=1 Tax=Roseibium sp. TaxID=1936156 RepID=UPI003A96C0D5